NGAAPAGPRIGRWTAGRTRGLKPGAPSPSIMVESTGRTNSEMSSQPQNVPVTILTGFLGSGKTTLLNRILREEHGHRIAVIENEFGEEGVDNELLLQNPDEQIVELNNGCICCTVRGDLVRILGDLRQRREAGDIAFDRVIIETTGMADPSPVAQTFF